MSLEVKGGSGLGRGVGGRVLGWGSLLLGEVDVCVAFLVSVGLAALCVLLLLGQLGRHRFQCVFSFTFSCGVGRVLLPEGLYFLDGSVRVGLAWILVLFFLFRLWCPVVRV